MAPNHSQAAIDAIPAPAIGEGEDYALACMAVSEARTEYDKTIIDNIVDGLSDGVTLRSLCRADGMPSYRTVYRWIKADDALASRIACAREAGHDCIADEILDIVDAPPMITASGGVDAGDVAYKRMRAETRLKLLAKWSPKKYGDKTTLAGDSENPLQMSLKVVFGKDS